MFSSQFFSMSLSASRFVATGVFISSVALDISWAKFCMKRKMLGFEETKDCLKFLWKASHALVVLPSTSWLVQAGGWKGAEVLK